MKPHDYDAITAVTVGYDEIARAMERRWGVGRLVRLVSDETRASYRRGWVAWRTAQDASNVRALLDIIPKMTKAVRFMDAEAAKLGHAPLAPEVWETRLEDGRVMAIVRTQAEAHAVVREGRAMVVYALDEVARLLSRIEIVDAIKREFPGAVVQQAVLTSEGHAQSWATSEPMHELTYGGEPVDVAPKAVA